MDNMFRPSSGHHQVQYKEMWSSTELHTNGIPLAFTINRVDVPDDKNMGVTLYYSTSSCIGHDDGYLMAETCCPF